MLPTPQKKSDFEFQKNQPVMEQVKKQRAPAENMDVVEILEKSAGMRGANAVDVNNELAHMVNSSPNVRVIRANNSLFIYFNHKNGNVKVYLETADTPRNLVDSIKQFGLAMGKSGFKTGQFDVQNPQILKAVKMAGIPVSLQSTNTVSPDGKTPLMTAVMEF
jgi:hypothetical protein